MKYKIRIILQARCSSKRFPYKSIYPIHSMPLAIFCAKRLQINNNYDLTLATSKNNKDNYLIKLAKKFGAEVPFLRPERISNSKSSSISCLIHALKWFKDNENWEPDNIAFCPPTNPFIKKDTVKKMFNLFEKNKKFNSIVSIFNSRNEGISPMSLIKGTSKLKK